jgi:hypothetical protein
MQCLLIPEGKSGNALRSARRIVIVSESTGSNIGMSTFANVSRMQVIQRMKGKKWRFRQ